MRDERRLFSGTALQRKWGMSILLIRRPLVRWIRIKRQVDVNDRSGNSRLRSSALGCTILRVPLSPKTLGQECSTTPRHDRKRARDKVWYGTILTTYLKQ